MDPLKPRARHGPEYHIQDLFIEYFEARGWHVERFIGNAFQNGIPDLNLFRRDWGERWVDVKVHGKYSFTKAQKKKWPEWEEVGRGIWIVGATSKKACTIEHMAKEHELLFQPPNWRDFWKPSWDEDIDDIIDQEFPGGIDPSA